MDGRIFEPVMLSNRPGESSLYDQTRVTPFREDDRAANLIESRPGAA